MIFFNDKKNIYPRLDKHIRYTLTDVLDNFNVIELFWYLNYVIIFVLSLSLSLSEIENSIDRIIFFLVKINDFIIIEI